MSDPVRSLRILTLTAALYSTSTYTTATAHRYTVQPAAKNRITIPTSTSPLLSPPAQELFEEDSSVLFVSVHVYDEEHSFYPNTGASNSPDEEGSRDRSRQSNILNLPLNGGADRTAFRRAIEQALFSIENFAPDMIFLSAGV